MKRKPNGLDADLTEAEITIELQDEGGDPISIRVEVTGRVVPGRKSRDRDEPDTPWLVEDVDFFVTLDDNFVTSRITIAGLPDHIEDRARNALLDAYEAASGPDPDRAYELSREKEEGV